MKILLIHNFYSQTGGEDMYVLSLKKLLESKGHTIYLLKRENTIKNSGIIQNVCTFINLFFNLTVEKELRNILEKEKPDIVHVHNIYYIISPQIYKICKEYNVPIIQTLHNYKLICPGAYLLNKNGSFCIHNSKNVNTIFKVINNCYNNSYLKSSVFITSILYHKRIKTYDFIDYFIVPNGFTGEIYETLFGIPNQKIKVVQYFTNSVELVNPKKEKNYFIYLGRLSEEKGITFLLKTLSHLNIRTIVIGQGPLKTYLESKYKSKNIVFAGFLSRKKVYDYLNGAVATIIPSVWYETGPISMIESFSVGVPIIVPRLGVFKEVVTNNKNGFFYERNNRKSLKNVIVSTWNIRNNLFEQRKNAKHTYKSKYLPNIHYKSLLKVYETAIFEKNKKSELQGK
jgi:glycosyltransferase involved in cell wall biosynthesis